MLKKIVNTYATSRKVMGESGSNKWEERNIGNWKRARTTGKESTRVIEKAKDNRQKRSKHTREY